MLFGLVLPFLFVLKIPLCLAQDHTAWALLQQEQNQELIKSYQEEALNLKNQSSSLKGCSLGKNISCLKQQNLKPTKTQQEFSDSSLYIFVSFSMPKEALKALAVEAKKYNAVLVIRGLTQNSFAKTATFLKELGEGVILDPTLFKEYSIQVVPTFVRKHDEGYSKISGNVSLAYALEKLKEGRK